MGRQMIFVVKWAKWYYYKNFKSIYKKNGINKDDYELKLVSPSSNTHPQVIIHILNHEFCYFITNATDKSITTNNTELNHHAAWNRFKVANKCGSTL